MYQRGTLASTAAICSLLLLVVSASTKICVAQSDPSVVGQWTSVQQFPYIAGHSHLLPSGKVLYWPTFSSGNNPQLWDPKTNTTTAAPRASFNIFCSGHSYLANGKLFVAGGHNGGSGYGLPYATIYDPTNDSWANTANMNDARWYPTLTTLANGDILTVTGDITPTTINTLPQVWQASSGTWRDLTNAQLAQPLYPNMFLAPNGKVAYVGPARASRYLDTSGTGLWSTLATQIFPNGRDYGNAVMFDAGKILAVGGDDPPTATAEVLDLNSATPAWVSTASMKTARRQANATLLPDGKVLVTGGSSGSGFDDETHPVYTTEMWDPASGTWSTMASISLYRGYHSTAVLLPDGRVLSSGGEKTGATYEVFSPPYLFKGARPTIASAPATVGYGETFFVQTPDAARITDVTWIALSAVTHAVNMNQRLLHLAFSQADGGLNITSPPNANLSPPGPYMLFLVDSNGVPSVAAFVRNTVGTSSVPNAPTGLAATAVSSREIDLQWVDNSNNETGFAVERSLDGTSFTQAATTAANVTTYADTTVSAATTYYYRVRALGSTGDSPYSNVASATTATANIPLVQKAMSSGTNVPSVSAAFPGENAAGNLLVAFVRASTTTQTVSVSDTRGNQYVEAVRQNQTGDKHQIRIFYAANSIAGANTVTASFSATNAHPFLAIFEYSGLSPTNPLDRTISAQGSGSAVSTGLSATTRSANELVFAGVGLPSSSSAVVTPGGGFTLELQDARKGFSRAATEDRFAAATGTFAGTFTLSGSTRWSAALATFSAAPIAPPALEITTSSLPNGTVNVAYTANLAATGGQPPYTWSLADGSNLPAGLTLSSNGTISGTPTTAGTTTFNVEVVDSSTSVQSASKALNITIDPAPSGTPITLMQSAAAKGAAVTSLSQPFATANAAGNLIIAFVRMSTTTQAVQLTDSVGNLYTEAVRQVQSTDGHQVRIFYAKNIAGGANTVTATFSATNNYPWLAIYEYSGLSATAPLDKVASSQGTATAVSTGATATTTSNNELVFAGLGLPASSTRTVTAGTGFTMLQQNNSAPSTPRAANEHRFVTSTGQFSGTFTLSGTTNWSAVVATFKQ